MLECNRDGIAVRMCVCGCVAADGVFFELVVCGVGANMRPCARARAHACVCACPCPRAVLLGGRLLVAVECSRAAVRCREAVNQTGGPSAGTCAGGATIAE